MRGTELTLTVQPVDYGITPACAGNRRSPRSNRGTPKDHPRVCGEQVNMQIFQQPYKGSPPRVRGTVDPLRQIQGLGWITPACAGNRQVPSDKRIIFWDHPRVCGEQASIAAFCKSVIGSPPRVRGTGRDVGIGSGAIGITPACAGNSGSPSPPLRRKWDHPRVCGEQQAKNSPAAERLGSPPRVRGTVDRRKNIAHRSRITPACAGNRIKHNQFV